MQPKLIQTCFKQVNYWIW